MAANDKIRKYVLPEDKMPEAWYNVIADLPSPPELAILFQTHQHFDALPLPSTRTPV